MPVSVYVIPVVVIAVLAWVIAAYVRTAKDLKNQNVNRETKRRILLQNLGFKKARPSTA